MNELLTKAKKLKQAAKRLAILSTEEKNEALAIIAETLIARKSYILEENEKDMASGKENGLSPSLLDRLQLTEERIHQIADGVRQVIQLPDPIGETIEQWSRPNGLLLKQIRVPLGVVGMVYEARPNVTVDAASLCQAC
ncbi:gamma-glutamyl phosphate reductase [Anoxybacillus flavithermus TNO-09.006]|uniref:Gamma-glutamyl phosphate reductase n=1 Tax=Anoxybacillus flavithermus TaxID=33934 RepID=A0A178TLI1_9BACL|nr:gamma-glutamyl phosphate reductase [Anoxybacillus flavithermus]ELK22116.1 gamma-glutamyl phosphate reductase [Anoxybacillus flavithermus TNO-09.006]OAO81021.1 Gamma-glutamyl phosphate reductase [Anoxybacillus flavithermus]